MKRSLVLIFLFIMSLSTTPAIYGDVIDPDQKEIPIYYQISNINSYPDYVFLFHGNPSPSFTVLDTGQFSFYKLSTVSIYAVNKADFNLSQLENFNSIQLDNYFTNNTSVIPSQLHLKGSYGAVDQTSTLTKVIIELKITSINHTDLIIKKNKIIYIYADGSNKSAEYQDQNITPQPDNNPDTNNNLWYFLLPVMAVIAILMVFLYRRSQ